MRTWQGGQVLTLPAISYGYHLAWKVLGVTLKAGTDMQYLLWVSTLRDSYTYNVPVSAWFFKVLKTPRVIPTQLSLCFKALWFSLPFCGEDVLRVLLLEKGHRLSQVMGCGQA